MYTKGHAGKEPFPTIYVDSKDSDAIERYEVAAKSQLKKIQKIFVRESYKNVDREKRGAEEAEKRMQNLEEAKKVTIEEDPTWTKAEKIRIFEGLDNRGKRIRIYGWVHGLRRQGKAVKLLPQIREDVVLRTLFLFLIPNWITRLGFYKAALNEQHNESTNKSLQNFIQSSFYLRLVQDDFVDCFGKPEVTGKLGTDIQDNKCSWLAVVCMQRANDSNN
uniref:Asparagine--tRNA ligase N-terminal domain-containing protein n=1 Tax=Glossina pallidipes TaxID=7398 RepID=A0A1A9ZDG0_GLOPL